MSENSKLFYEFGSFRLDEKERRLLREGEEVTFRENGRAERLTPKAFDLLLLLVKQSGQMIGRDELIERLWPGTFVEDNRLSDNVSTLRKFLSDPTRNPQFIETVPKHGYRFVAEVREVRDETIAIVDQTKTHIIIEEELETSPADAADANGPALREQTFAPALPPAKVARRRLTPLAIVLACVMLGGLALAAYLVLRGKTQPVVPALSARSIAVLPFKPLVVSAGNPGLELGMTDAIITRLSNIRQMTVRPTNSILSYGGEGQDLRSIGSQLGVDVLLDGRVQREGDRIRVSVQLVRTGDGTTIWADKFDEKFTNIFAVQDVISERVAAALALKLTGEEKKGIAKRYTDNLEAYELYLKGRERWSTFTRAGREASINYYNEALKIDPGYALAYTGLATAYTVIAIYGPPSAAEMMPKAQETVRKALALDQDLAEAHVAFGAVKIFYERDWPGAALELKRGMELNPNHADAYILYGYYLQATGRFEEAIISMRRAKDLAPQWHVPENDVLESFFFARRYDQAVEQARQKLRLEPNFGYAYYVLGKTLTQQGLYAEAAAELQRGIDYPEMAEHIKGRLMAELSHTYAVSGKRGDFVRLLEQLKEKPDPWRPLQFAKISAGLGDKDQAFAWLRKAADEQLPFAWTFKIEPHFDNLRSDPRYLELLRRMKLEP